MEQPTHLSPGYRRALVASAALNGAMFFIEGGVGQWIGSSALLADAVDFLEDAGIYVLAVVALGWLPRSRAQAGMVMSFAMFAVGMVAVWQIVDRLLHGGAPPPLPMGATAFAALAVNVFCAWRLSPWKRGDASMRSVWLSTRNDAILNMATIVAAGAVALTATAWPDLAAGVLIAALNLWASVEIFRQSRREMTGPVA